MNRRQLFVGASALGVMGLGAAAVAQGLRISTAAQAWLYALPMIEMATTRARVLKAPGAAINRLAHGRELSDHTARRVTTPNNDTLYSIAFLDLSQGPATLTVPATGARYWSAAIMDMFTNNNAVLGLRTVGGEGGAFTLVGPGQPAKGPNPVRVATPHAWLLIRTLVVDEADLPAARKVQDGFVLSGPMAAPPPAYAARDAEAGDYFAAARALLAADPPPATDQKLLRKTAAFLGAGPFDAGAARTGAQEAQMITRFAKGRQTFTDGWAYPRANLGDYGQDYTYRAIVALMGLGALPVAEAMYMKAAGDDGAGLFTGDGLYRLSLPADMPLDGFWSLSMYEATEDGQFFFTDNPLNRYAIGDRTAGLEREADGSLNLWIGRTDPGGERSSNWLPAPKTGPFAMYLRTYLPRAELLDGRFRFKPVEKV
uniref:Phosphatidylserine decarboxylase n=1 Tax=Caulobacter sp. (strain K31) TaxID=366602 RepID=B0T709_CAUSK